MEKTTIDKSTWPHRGAWDSEPDVIHFIDPGTQLPCLIARAPAWGNLCGYVGVPVGHPAFRLRLRDNTLPVIRSLTWSSDGYELADALNHAGPLHFQRYADSETWWIGFDCAHGYDFRPNSDTHLYQTPDYRDVEYVRQHAKMLAHALKEMGTPVVRGLPKGKARK